MFVHNTQDLHGNALTGCLSDQCTRAKFRHLRALTHVSLAENAFTGKFPDEFSKMPWLVGLCSCTDCVVPLLCPPFCSLSFSFVLIISLVEIQGSSFNLLCLLFSLFLFDEPGGAALERSALDWAFARLPKVEAPSSVGLVFQRVHR